MLSNVGTSNLLGEDRGARRFHQIRQESRPMSAELINKAVVTQFITEVFGRFSGEHVPALVTGDFCAHAWASRGIADGTQHISQVLTLLRATFRDPSVSVLDLLAQGDRV